MVAAEALERRTARVATLVKVFIVTVELIDSILVREIDFGGWVIQGLLMGIGRLIECRCKNS
jgi:hypothetical protein